jgi:hypothetical protein
MFDRYKIKKRYMAATNEIIKPELKGYRSISEDSALHTPTMKRHIGSVLRLAACMVLVITLVGVIVFQNSGGFSTKTTTVQNGTSAQGTATKDSFTLLAYAASPSSVDNGVTPAIKNIDQSTGTTLQSNVNITLPTGGDKETDQFSSGFQFSGDNIASITMTAQKGSLTAENADVIPLFKKWWSYGVQEAKEHIADIQKDPNYKVPQYQMTPEEQKLWNSDYKTGKSVSFSPAGFTVWWDDLFAQGNLSDTVNITIKFNDGTTQNKTLSIIDDGSGNLTATLK